MILSSRSVKPTPMSTPVNWEDAKQKSGEREAPRQFRTLDAADHDVTWSLDDATVAREGSPLGLAVAPVALAAAAVVLRGAVENLLPEAGLGNAEAVGVARHGREVGQDGDVRATASAAQEAVGALVGVAGFEPLKAARVVIQL